ncbi:MAG TPA: DNA repair protein RadC [Caldisericia bacterium]|nr:DNA repair protein RadC [Caldisericia bacterium]HOL82418.1 DNA repair protein RadC [Caldisericia bacterium]HPP43165.1 DNA repair protein RadC [Caldisericia bacterium]
MKNKDNKKKEIFDILVENKAYPYINKKGNLYFRKKIKFLDYEKIKEIKNLFEIKDKESCDKFREDIKKEVLKNKEYVPIKNWIKEERPREMLIKYGEKNLSLSKLLSIILRIGKEGESAEELAKKILNKYKSLREIDSVSIDELCKIEGIGLAKAAQIKASFEIGKRLMKETSSEKKKIKSPDDIIDFVSEYYGSYLRDVKKEFFNIILLDIKNKIVDSIELSKGSINASVVDPKEVIKEATLKSASSIILVHNHPSGDTEPSTDDINITKKIKEACDIVGIKVLDHIIIGKNKEDYTSFAKLGLI